MLGRAETTPLVHISDPGRRKSPTIVMKNVLCIDVGGTRIKAAVLPERLTDGVLGELPVCVLGSLGWLNRSLPELLSPDNPFSLVNRPGLAADYDAVAIGVPGPVVDGRFLRTDLDVPEELGREFERLTDKPIIVVKDADAWTIGAATWALRSNQEIGYPAVGLTLGTGAGVSLVLGPDRFRSQEVSGMAVRFAETERVSGYAIDQNWKVHHVLGNPFFEWVRADKRHWTRRRVQQEYTKRVVAFLHDLRSCLTLQGVLLGGGNAAFVSAAAVRSQTGVHIMSFSDASNNIGADLVSLLGLHRLTFADTVQIEG
jgi:predicted NBD/HSP70 family sugar kinase